MDKSDFKVMVRRVPGYEPAVSLRFEMNEGYGELHVGERKKTSPSAFGEVAEVSGEVVRVGRFVHVLASGRRRQSYALSRLDDDRLQRLPDDKWIELSPVTEFGIRYLELPALEGGATVATVQVAASASPTPERSATPTPAASASSGDSLLSRVRSRSSSVQPAAARTAAPRAASPTPDRARSTSPAPSSASVATRSPPPTRVASPGPGGPRVPDSRGVSVTPSLGRDAVGRLSVDQLREHLLAEMDKVEALHKAVDDLTRRLDASKEREADLVAIIGSWSERG